MPRAHVPGGKLWGKERSPQLARGKSGHDFCGLARAMSILAEIQRGHLETHAP